jgi:hypothetical protein
LKPNAWDFILGYSKKSVGRLSTNLESFEHRCQYYAFAVNWVLEGMVMLSEV